MKFLLIINNEVDGVGQPAVNRIKSQRSSLCEANSTINIAKTDLNKIRKS